MADIFVALNANPYIFTRDKVTTSVAMDKFKDYTIQNNSKIIKPRRQDSKLHRVVCQQYYFCSAIALHININVNTIPKHMSLGI